MTFLKSALAKAALVGAVAAGALAVTSTTASAEIVCNRWNECWHVRDHYPDYPASLRIIFHDDAWRATHHRHWRWRADRDDHGYYNRGRWHRF